MTPIKPVWIWKHVWTNSLILNY